MPDIVTVYRWMAARDDFRQNYVRAREEQADTYADEIAEIADRDDLDPNDKRVRIDARKWVAAKLKPKKYSDAVKISGDAESPLTVNIIRLGDESPP